MPDVALPGCETSTLLGYLKGVGILSTVARHVTSTATLHHHERGYAVLRSPLDQGELMAFLLDEWPPTPVVSPWNGGSGFWPADDTAGLDALCRSELPRLEPFRRAARAARAALDQLGVARGPAGTKEEKKAIQDERTAIKPKLLRTLRSTLPDEALRWMDAAIVLGDGDPGFPPLLGAGGNDGRFEISNNVAQCLAKVLRLVPKVRVDSPAAWLSGALFGDVASLEAMSLGQFRREKSPTNTPQGPKDGLADPWDLILAVEGTTVFAAGIARRFGTSEGAVVAPFTFRAVGAGHASAVPGEKGRDEMWLPVVTAPTRLNEWEALAREARADAAPAAHGRSRRPAVTATDAAVAAGRLGVASGITRFNRFVILERAGQANMPLYAGGIDVRAKPALRVLTPRVLAWLDAVRRHTADEKSGQGPRAAARRLEAALFDFADRPTAMTLEALIVAMGDAEAALVLSAPASDRARPFPQRESARAWVEVADDGSPEFAVAVALASGHDAPPSPDRPDSAVPLLRDLWHGTDLAAGTDGYQIKRAGVWRSPRRSFVDRIAAVAVRRHLDAARRQDQDGAGSETPLPPKLAPGGGVAVTLAPLAAWANGELDDDRVGALFGGLVLLDYRRISMRSARSGTEWALPDPTLETLMLATWGGATGAVPELRHRIGEVARLASGHADAVLAAADVRLRIAGQIPLVNPRDLFPGDAERTIRLAASVGLARPSSEALADAGRRRLRPTETDTALRSDPVPTEPKDPEE